MTTHSFTTTYISMARAAEEIQAMRTHSPNDRPTFSNYDLGDWFIEQRAAQVVCLGDSFAYDDGGICQAEYSGEEEYPQAWLPRLDQILGMLEPTPLHFVGFVSYEISMKRDPYWQKFPDWHELALAVVMREKFGKAWREGKWVKA